jgi:hypothetical protein
MAHNWISRLTKAGPGSRLVILPLLALIGCGDLRSDYSAFDRWMAGTANGSASAPRANNNASTESERKAAASEKETTTAKKLKERQSAAAEALVESRKARSAAEAAKKEYEQASQAYRQASQATERAGNGNQAGGSSNSAGGSPTSPVVILSSISEGSGNQNQARTVAMIHEINESLAKVDSAKLDPNDAKRRDLAAQLVRSAQRALVQNDYPEAKSLAEKASVMIAPLMRNQPKASPSS